MDYPIEMVEWIDSTGFSGWRSVLDIHDLDPLNCRSVGYVVRETDAALYIAHSLDEQKGSSLRVMDALTIPKVAITSRNVIRAESRAALSATEEDAGPSASRTS